MAKKPAVKPECRCGQGKEKEILKLNMTNAEEIGNQISDAVKQANRYFEQNPRGRFEVALVGHLRMKPTEKEDLFNYVAWIIWCSLAVEYGKDRLKGRRGLTDLDGESSMEVSEGLRAAAHLIVKNGYAIAFPGGLGTHTKTDSLLEKADEIRERAVAVARSQFEIKDGVDFRVLWLYLCHCPKPAAPKKRKPNGK
ncbi:MAG: hypothetical protein PHU42_00645 [Patescibacteria group bacterium]|nr:hypothetical protein [Patescibacteria group bacterium]